MRGRVSEGQSRDKYMEWRAEIKRETMVRFILVLGIILAVIVVVVDDRVVTTWWSKCFFYDNYGLYRTWQVLKEILEEANNCCFVKVWSSVTIYDKFFRPILRSLSFDAFIVILIAELHLPAQVLWIIWTEKMQYLVADSSIPDST